MSVNVTGKDRGKPLRNIRTSNDIRPLAERIILDPYSCALHRLMDAQQSDIGFGALPFCLSHELGEPFPDIPALAGEAGYRESPARYLDLDRPWSVEHV